MVPLSLPHWHRLGTSILQIGKQSHRRVISLLAVRSEPEAKNPASQLTSREGKAKSLASTGWVTVVGGGVTTPQRCQCLSTHTPMGYTSLNPAQTQTGGSSCGLSLRFIRQQWIYPSLSELLGFASEMGIMPITLQDQSGLQQVGSFEPAPTPTVPPYHPPSSNIQDRTKFQNASVIFLE